MTAGEVTMLQYARDPSGAPIAECELAPTESGLLAALAAEAHAGGAARLCVYCTADLSAAGFAARDGYRRMTVASVPPGQPLPVLDQATVRDVWPRAFVGQWGHHQVRPADYEAVHDAIYVGLPGNEDWLGLCRVEPRRRAIDGPGFVGARPGPQAAQALVLGACVVLGAGPATLETWGDVAAPYRELGFTVAEECPGWELALS